MNKFLEKIKSLTNRNLTEKEEYILKLLYVATEYEGVLIPYLKYEEEDDFLDTFDELLMNREIFVRNEVKPLNYKETEKYARICYLLLQELGPYSVSKTLAESLGYIFYKDYYENVTLEIYGDISDETKIPDYLSFIELREFIQKELQRILTEAEQGFVKLLLNYSKKYGKEGILALEDKESNKFYVKVTELIETEEKKLNQKLGKTIKNEIYNKLVLFINAVGKEKLIEKLNF